MAKSDYQEANVLNGTLRTATFTEPAAIYVALFTSPTSDAGGGTEVSAGGYARVQHGPGDSFWSAPTLAGLVQNVGNIQFADPTADWGTITHFALYDAVTAGNSLYHGPLTASVSVTNGQLGPRFGDGALQVTET